MFGCEVAEKVRIQYGGSMKASNARELVAQKDIDGGLIGGAALKAGDFSELIKEALGK
jgi:triosephosphate isomerase